MKINDLNALPVKTIFYNDMKGYGGTRSMTESKEITVIENSGSGIAVIEERTIRDMIYDVRGYKVGLDFELADMYTNLVLILR